MGMVNHLLETESLAKCMCRKQCAQVVEGRDGKELFMGYGACSVSGCPCQGFKDTYGSDLCNNCGHKYSDHW
jgi:hypothetical protein